MNPLYQAMIEDMVLESEDGTFSDTNEDMIIGTIDDNLDGQKPVVLHDDDEDLDDDSDEVSEDDFDDEEDNENEFD